MIEDGVLIAVMTASSRSKRPSNNTWPGCFRLPGLVGEIVAMAEDGHADRLVATDRLAAATNPSPPLFPCPNSTRAE